MNSLLGGFGNMLFKTTPTATPAAAQPNILLQALGAAMRGESPQAFMQNLAMQHPQLRQLDLNNLQSTAQQVCQQNGVNVQDMANKIDNVANSFMK